MGPVGMDYSFREQPDFVPGGDDRRSPLPGVYRRPLVPRMIKLRDVTEDDFANILQLNDAEVQQTSPMDLDRIRFLHGLSSFHQVALADGRAAGFLLALREGAAYPNDNYAWFQSRYPRFIYIDRIVVGAEFTGQRIGSALYQALFACARASGTSIITCEYNLEPPNPASAAFHARFGFREVGRQRVADGAKLVSLQLRNQE